MGTIIKVLFLIALFQLPLLPVIAQEGEQPPAELMGEPMFYRDTVPDLTITQAPKKKAEEPKKVKIPKNTFYGMKCRKSFTKSGAGKKQQLEMFYYLKKPADPDFYVQDVFVFDLRTRKVMEISKKEKFDPSFQKILHGPYKRTVGGVVIEQGIYYIGTKHGRWELYSNEKKEEFNGEEMMTNVLLEKKKYYKGWPRDARVTYYDAARKKVKEVYPYENGKLNGRYYYFLENGQVLKRGMYEHGKKVGIWQEYYKDRNKVQKEIKYPDSPFDETKPFVLNEWDERNNQVMMEGKKVEPGANVETDPIKKALKKKR